MTTDSSVEIEAGSPERSTPGVMWPGVYIALGVVLVALVFVSGQPSLNAPWIQGDEYYFIVNNSDVTGAGRSEPLLVRCLSIFNHKHRDLYQPVPILSYALEWRLWGEARVSGMRATDVALHALTGLLLWVALRGLLLTLGVTKAGPAGTLLAYALALLWALHPVNVDAYSADMGRTHLMSATMALLSLLAHLRYLRTRQAAWSVLAIVLLTLAMMSKPVVGWFALVFVLEWHVLGLRSALRSPRVYVMAALGVLFALLTLKTTQEAEMLEDFTDLLFGDPISRSLFATWLYARNLLAPAWLCTWYVPVPWSTWDAPAVWGGLVLVVASGVALLWSLPRPARRGIAVGLTWFWVLLLPVVGIIGARLASANDRYVYQPLMGLLLVVGVLLARWVSRAAGARRAAVVVAAALLLSAAAVPWNRWLCANARTTLRRAERVVDLYPDHPHAREALALAYEFSATHDTPERDAFGHDELLAKARATLDLAVTIADEHSDYYVTPHDRAAFERRVAFRYLLYDAPELSLEHALQAYELEPDSLSTWTRLAQAYRALQRWPLAAAAYKHLEEILPADDRWRSKRLAEYGNLLLRRLDQPSQAIGKLREALAGSGLEPEERKTATLDLALAEIRGGHGATGAGLVDTILAKDPDNIEALLVMGEFHMRSHHWQQAEQAYAAILVRHPTHYRAMRGLHEALAQQDRHATAAMIWLEGYEHSPQKRAFRSFAVWAAACADAAGASRECEALLADDPENPLACYAQCLLTLRAGELGQAREWAQTARRGQPIEEERADRRAAAMFEHMVDVGTLPAEARLLSAEIWLDGSERARAEAALGRYGESDGTPVGAAVAEELRARLSGEDGGS
ncbi:MAG: hypothetical protein JXO22_17215 [Phycisphaerae bacterium]|nr:hypothetical protein [Phycisphaerae bacterium]